MVPTILELSGQVDHALLVSAIEHAFGRHPALRSRFRMNIKRRRIEYSTDGAPPSAGFTDATGGDWPREKLDDLIDELCYRSFDLAAEAPARAEVIRTGPAATLIVLTVHHIVFDGWSRRILVDEIAEIYQAGLDGREPRLAEPAHPADVLAAPPKDELDARTAAAVDRLRGAPMGIALPYDAVPSGESPLIGAFTTTRFDADLTERVMAAAAREGCTAFMAGVAILAGALARECKQDDFLFAVVWPGRDDPASHDVIGMFMNTLVLRIGLDGHTTWRQLLRNARTSAMEAFIDADVPFSALTAALDRDRDVGRQPLTPVMINAAEVPGPFELAPGVRGSYRRLGLAYSKWDMTVFVHLDDGSDRAHMELSLDYSRDLFKQSTIDNFVAALRRSTADLANSPEEMVLEQSVGIDLNDPSQRLELVRSAWQDVLGVADVDDDTGFFEAGGDSLLLVALVEQLNNATGRTFKTMEFFRAGSISGQAALLGKAAAAEDGK